MISGAARVAPEKAVFRPVLPMSILPGISEMQMLTFKEQIKHPKWQKRRLHMLEAANWACVSCDAKEVTLNVHHKRYIKGRMYWEYNDDELEVLCEDCHAQEHAGRDLLKRVIDAAEIGGNSQGSAACLLAGYLWGEGMLDQEVYAAAVEIDGHMVDVGVVASCASGAPWARLAAAAKTLQPRLKAHQRDVLKRWDGDTV